MITSTHAYTATALLITALALAPAPAAAAPHSGSAQPANEAPNTIAPQQPAAESDFFEPGTLKAIAGGLRFTEGPLWDPARNRLIFSDIAADAIYTLTPPGEGAELAIPEILRQPAERANGNAFTKDGRIVNADHNGRITIAAADDMASATVIASKWDGKRLNSPNDIVVHPDGSLWFTDPTFGIRPQEREIPFTGIFRLTKAADKDEWTIEVATQEMQLPNGLAFSPDFKTLYAAEFRENEIHAFDVNAAATKPEDLLTNKRLIAKMEDPARGRADGLKVDVNGNIYTTGPGGLWVFSPEGKELARLAVPGASNLCFGGADNKTIFITAGPAVFSVRAKHAGFLPDWTPQAK